MRRTRVGALRVAHLRHLHDGRALDVPHLCGGVPPVLEAAALAEPAARDAAPRDGQDDGDDDAGDGAFVVDAAVVL